MSLGHVVIVFTGNLLKMVSNGIFRSDIGPLKLKPAHSLSFSHIRTASLTVIKPWCLSISFPSNFPGKPENSCPMDVTEIIYRCGIEVNVHSYQIGQIMFLAIEVSLLLLFVLGVKCTHRNSPMTRNVIRMMWLTIYILLITRSIFVNKDEICVLLICEQVNA